MPLYLIRSTTNEIIPFPPSKGMTTLFNCADIKLVRLDSAAQVMTELESPLQLQRLINDGGSDRFEEYLSAVDEIQQFNKSGFITGNGTHGTHANKILQQLFQGILNCSIRETKSDALSSTVYSSSITSSYGYELQGSNHIDRGELSSEQIYRLRSIVERLHDSGCIRGCIEMYRISRKSAVDARFLRFCIGRWTINDLQNLGCEEFSAKIRIWILAAYRCYNSIFPGEKRYYEQIFHGLGAVTYDNCFLPIVRHAAIELNYFVLAVSSIASFQKLFAVLELYEALVVILPKIQNMFHSESAADMSHWASKTTKSLPNLIRKLMLCFEDTVLNERLNRSLSNGKIHSLTEYTMTYVAKIMLYKELLKRIIVSRPTKSLGNQADDNFLEASNGSPLGLHIIWIMMSLRINLEGKSSLCEDSSLRYIFLMNNVGYIARTIKESPELLEMIGRDYPLKLRKDVLQIAEEYISSISQRVLYCLRDDGLNYKFPFFNGVSKKSQKKKRLETFNATLEEVCLTHSYVLDMQLVSQLDALIICKLLPDFKSFLEKYGGDIQFEKYKERCIKDSSENLEGKIKKIVCRTKSIHNVVAADSGIYTKDFVRI